MIVHLPGVIRRPGLGEPTHFTLVTACGKRGPIKLRESGAPPQDLFPEATDWERGVCPDCLVRWDEAEETGSLQVVWTMNGKTEWLAGGAVVFVEPPMCPKCRARHSQPVSFVFAAVVR